MNELSEHRTSRRAFLAKGAAAGALTLGAGRLLIDTPTALAGEALPAGDTAILRSAPRGSRVELGTAP